MARVTLAYPGLEDWNILPVMLEVPVEEARSWGRLRHYSPWGLGAILVAGIAWLVLRKKAKRGRTRPCT